MKDKRWVTTLVTLVFCLVFLAVPSENVWAMPFNPAVGYDVEAAPHLLPYGTSMEMAILT